MFGAPRLKETMARAPGGRELIDHVLSDLEAFTGPDAEQEDDITMVTLQRSAGAGMVSAESNGRVLAEFELASEPGNEREAMARVEDAVAGLGLEPARLERLKTAVAEATMNAMEHGNEYRADRPVSIRVIHTPERVERARHRPRGRRRAARAGETRPGGEARRPPEAARLGPAPDREDGRRGARDERGGQAHRRARPAPGRRRTMTTSELQATVRERDGVAVIDLTGDLNSSAEDALNEAYAQATGSGAGSVVLNFERAEYINSTGIALIVGLLAQARANRVQVKAFGLSDHYREIFEITRLADFMTITDDEDRAVSGAEGRHDA